MGTEVRVRIDRREAVHFEATNADGVTLSLDGPESLGGAGQGLRPMQLLLVSLAGCSAMDVIHILTRQREPLEGLTIDVNGTRADAIPAVYTDIHMHFTATGAVAENKLARAVSLSVEKYCSVAHMLRDVNITHSHELAR